MWISPSNLLRYTTTTPMTLAPSSQSYILVYKLSQHQSLSAFTCLFRTSLEIIAPSVHYPWWKHKCLPHNVIFNLPILGNETSKFPTSVNVGLYYHTFATSCKFDCNLTLENLTFIYSFRKLLKHWGYSFLRTWDHSKLWWNDCYKWVFGVYSLIVIKIVKF